MLIDNHELTPPKGQEAEAPKKHPVPSLELVKRAIEIGALNKTGEDDFAIDQFKFDLVTTDAESLFGNLRNQISEEAVPIPEGYDLNQKTKRALRDAIDIVHKMKLVKRDTLVTASGLAGPENTFVVDEMVKATAHFFGRTMVWNEETENIDWIPPMPISPRSIRNIRNHIAIGKPAIQVEAGLLIRQAEKAHISLSPEHALDLAIFEIVSHEYGHMLNDALAIEEHPTINKSNSVQMQRTLGNLPKEIMEIVHREHVARGMEDILLKEYMGTRMSPGHTDMLLKSRAELNDMTIPVNQFIEFLKKKGYTIKDEMDMHRALREGLIEKWGEDKTNTEFQSLLQLIQYGLPAYTEDEIKFLFQEDN